MNSKIKPTGPQNRPWMQEMHQTHQPPRLKEAPVAKLPKPGNCPKSQFLVRWEKAERPCTAGCMLSQMLTTGGIENIHRLQGLSGRGGMAQASRNVPQADRAQDSQQGAAV